MQSRSSSSLPSDPSTAPIQVAVVEDDAACRAALEQAIAGAPDMALCWAVGQRREALERLADAQACASLDVLLVDIGLPDGSGLDVISACRRQCPQVASIVSTIFGDEKHVLRAIEEGAMGYLLKDLTPPEVLDELRSLHAGGSPINPMVARKLLMRQSSATPVTPASTPALASLSEPDIVLSSRETQVLRLVARGHTLDEVAREMGVTRHTVRSFVRRIYAKLQVDSRLQAVNEAIRKGLLPQDLRDV